MVTARLASEGRSVSLASASSPNPFCGLAHLPQNKRRPRASVYYCKVKADLQTLSLGRLWGNFSFLTIQFRNID